MITQWMYILILLPIIMIMWILLSIHGLLIEILEKLDKSEKKN